MNVFMLLLLKVILQISQELFRCTGPQDAEQEPFNGIIRGIDHADLLLVRAPKPALIIATTGDILVFRDSGRVQKKRQAYIKLMEKRPILAGLKISAASWCNPEEQGSNVCFFPESS